MTDHPSQRAHEIFLELATLDPAAAREQLARIAGDDTELRAAVSTLLDAHAQAQRAGFLAGSTTQTGPITEQPGSRIGPFKLLQRIGEGGFGTVFLAEQTEPIRRRVALKIIKLGMDTRQVIARFEAERQALAMMNHPHIARVLDGGITESGRPYFVMEYVVGDAITRFADAHKLNVDERLALFTQVCQAVQHAHTKGVIHRDLKPANVLVSMVDGKPFARVIDFGIAKATGAAGERLTDKTLFTLHGQLIGTPEYMSPEQAGGDPDIDTRTDVYALGVLLYELLTGSTPFRLTELKRFVLDDIRKMIREQDPPSPSLRLSRDLETLAATASARRVEPGRLGALVKGELDWIVMKALEKDRARRYESATSLASDVGRHLSGEAVVAAPPSRVYRVRKFVRTHRGPVAAGSAVGAALLIGFAGTAWGLWQADAERDRTRAANESLAKQRDVAARQRDMTKAALESLYQPGDVIDNMAEATTFGFLAGFRLRDDYRKIPVEDREIAEISALATFVVNEFVDQLEIAEWSAYTANLALAQAAMEAGNYPEARERIAACPEGKRGWEWGFLEERAREIEWVGPRIDSAAISAQGDLVFCARPNEQGATIYAIADETTVLAEVDLPHWARTAAFSPTNTAVLTHGYGNEGDTAQIIDVATGTVRGHLQNVIGRAGPRSFSPDGSQVLAMHADGTPRVYDASNGALLRELPGYQDATKGGTALTHGHAEFSPDGLRALVSYSRNPPRVLDGATGATILELDLPFDRWCESTFSPDGGQILTRDDARYVSLWDSHTGELRMTFAHPGLMVWQAMFSPDGSCIVTCSSHDHYDDIIVHCWEAATGRLLDSRQTDRRFFFAQGLPGSKLFCHLEDIAGDRSAMLDINALGAAYSLQSYGDLPPLELSVEAILASAPGEPVAGLTLTTPDASRRIVGGADRTVRFFDVASDREVASIRVDDAVTNLKMTADGTRLIIMLADGSARVWDVRDPSERRKDYERAWAERVPAGAYLDELMAGPTATGELMATLEAQATLTPLRRLVAAKMLQERLADMEHEARTVMEELTQGQTDPAAVQAAAEALDLPPRVKAMVVERAGAWEYEPPRVDPEALLAEETRQRRLAAADLVMERAVGDDDPAWKMPTLDDLRDAAHARKEALGQDDDATLIAQYEYAKALLIHGEVDAGLGQLAAVLKVKEVTTPIPDVMLVWMWSEAAAYYTLYFRLDEAERVHGLLSEWVIDVYRADPFLRLGLVDAEGNFVWRVSLDEEYVAEYAREMRNRRGVALRELALRAATVRAVRHHRDDEYERVLDVLQRKERTRVEVGEQEGVSDLTLLAMAHHQLALQTKGDEADTHRAAARDALAKARALMAPSPDGTPSPWVDDADARALLAEAGALVEGGGGGESRDAGGR